MPEWLTADITSIIAKHTDFKTYVKLLSLNKLTQTTLTPGRAAVVYPHAIRHMHALIREERMKSTDPEFEFEKTLGSMLVYTTAYDDGAKLKSYYQLRVDEFMMADNTTITIIVNRRTFMLLDAGFEFNVPIGFARAVITPDFEDPFKSGSIRLVSYVDDEHENTVEQYDRMVYYNDGFGAILHELACDMCPLMQED
jgi:hypothetical protein